MNILFEDSEIIVCHKEAGLAVESFLIGKPDLVSQLKSHLRGGYLGVVHRLDMPVEGLLLFAKTKAAAATLSKNLSDGTLGKDYLALVYGKPDKDEGTLTDYLAVKKLPGKSGKIASVSTSNDPEAKKAVLNYKVLGSRDNLSLLDVSIETGRFHQIRVQTSNAGFPIIADQKYGSAEGNAEAAKLGVKNVALFANRISFSHPKTGKKMHFEFIPDIPLIKELIS